MTIDDGAAPYFDAHLHQEAADSTFRLGLVFLASGIWLRRV